MTALKIVGFLLMLGSVVALAAVTLAIYDASRMSRRDRRLRRNIERRWQQEENARIARMVAIRQRGERR